MLPKSYTVFKWLVYALATLLLFSLQSLLLNHIRVLNLLPFLYPVLPAVAAMYEGPRRGPVFGLSGHSHCLRLHRGEFHLPQLSLCPGGLRLWSSGDRRLPHAGGDSLRRRGPAPDGQDGSHRGGPHHAVCFVGHAGV